MSASLLVHNRIAVVAASQKGPSPPSETSKSPTHRLFLCEIEAGDFLDTLNSACIFKGFTREKHDDKRTPKKQRKGADRSNETKKSTGYFETQLS